MQATWIEILNRSVRWQDVVDVLLLTLLFSALYRFSGRPWLALGGGETRASGFPAHRAGLRLPGQNQLTRSVERTRP